MKYNYGLRYIIEFAKQENKRKDTIMKRRTYGWGVFEGHFDLSRSKEGRAPTGSPQQALEARKSLARNYTGKEAIREDGKRSMDGGEEEKEREGMEKESNSTGNTRNTRPTHV